MIWSDGFSAGQEKLPGCRAVFYFLDDLLWSRSVGTKGTMISQAQAVHRLIRIADHMSLAQYFRRTHLIITGSDNSGYLLSSQREQEPRSLAKITERRCSSKPFVWQSTPFPFTDVCMPQFHMLRIDEFYERLCVNTVRVWSILAQLICLTNYWMELFSLFICRRNLCIRCVTPLETTVSSKKQSSSDVKMRLMDFSSSIEKTAL